jgi:pyridoxamine 5'-phosphate oxidase
MDDVMTTKCLDASSEPVATTDNEAMDKFQNWYAAARKRRDIADPSAMALATADCHGGPAVRMVLLKAFDERGFVFYTNLTSPKAHDLDENPRAALCFHWVTLRRQVRVSGAVERTTDREADAYFASRARLSQLGAWASAQSRVMPNRFALQSAVASVILKFGLGAIPRPPHWSGYRVVPRTIEFWAEQPFRHHERLLFKRTQVGWQKQWLYP